MLGNFWCIYKREIRAYVTMPAAYVVLMLFTLVNGFFFNMAVGQFALASTQMQGQQYAGYTITMTEWVISPLLANMSVIMLFFLPVLTMRLFAEEKRLGTAELLFSYPFRDGEVLAGKFTAAVTVFTAMLALTGVSMILLIVYGEPELPVLLVGYLGLWLMGTAFISLTVFISSLTESQIVAAIGGLGSLLLLWVVSWVGDQVGPGLRRVFQQISIYQHYESMSKGVLETNDIVYYVLFSALFLFLTLRSLESKKWRS